MFTISEIIMIAMAAAVVFSAGFILACSMR